MGVLPWAEVCRLEFTTGGVEGDGEYVEDGNKNRLGKRRGGGFRGVVGGWSLRDKIAFVKGGGSGGSGVRGLWREGSWIAG